MDSYGFLWISYVICPLENSFESWRFISKKKKKKNICEESIEFEDLLVEDLER